MCSSHDLAERLRGKLQTWCAELDPPGLALAPMAQVWNDYFDHYLEGKPVAAPAAPEGSVQGWLCRNGTAAIRDGALVITADPDAANGARPFLTHAGLNLSGPVTATVKLRAAKSGIGTLAWRTREQKDFAAANTAPITWRGSAEVQEVVRELPVRGSLVHLRIQPAKEANLAIESIELRGSDGKTQSWHFNR